MQFSLEGKHVVKFLTASGEKARVVRQTWILFISLLYIYKTLDWIKRKVGFDLRMILFAVRLGYCTQKKTEFWGKNRNFGLMIFFHPVLYPDFQTLSGAEIWLKSWVVAEPAPNLWSALVCTMNFRWYFVLYYKMWRTSMCRWILLAMLPFLLESRETCRLDELLYTWWDSEGFIRIFKHFKLSCCFLSHFIKELTV